MRDRPPSYFGAVVYLIEPDTEHTGEQIEDVTTRRPRKDRRDRRRSGLPHRGEHHRRLPDWIQSGSSGFSWDAMSFRRLSPDDSLIWLARPLTMTQSIVCDDGAGRLCVADRAEKERLMRIRKQVALLVIAVVATAVVAVGVTSVHRWREYRAHDLLRMPPIGKADRRRDDRTDVPRQRKPDLVELAGFPRSDGHVQRRGV